MRFHLIERRERERERREEKRRASGDDVEAKSRR